MVECCFTSTKTVGLLGTGAQDGHLDFHIAPELCVNRLADTKPKADPDTGHTDVTAPDRRGLCGGGQSQVMAANHRCQTQVVSYNDTLYTNTC